MNLDLAPQDLIKVKKNMNESIKWDVLSLIQVTTRHFLEKQVDEARLQVEYMLADVLNLNRMDLYLNFDRPITPTELETFRKYCKRKLNGEPLQYILGNQDFMGLSFKTDARGLIPRPETELIIEEIVNAVSAKNMASPRILDIGTGSGCIAITLAKLIQDSRLLAVDVSDEALALAKENAARLSMSNSVQFECLDVLNKTFPTSFTEEFDVIVSNPPYIPIREKSELQVEVRQFEPSIALFVEDGLEFYHKITSDAKDMLSSGGLLVFEIHCEAKDEMESILNQHEFRSVTFKKDYSGLYRVALAEKN
jgi:release factor glutamine methyltransferase